jgi:hypothetical protein
VGFLWRIGPMANMSGQSSGDGNFKERGRRARHDNAGYDLRRTVSQKRVNNLAIKMTHLFHQRRESNRFPLRIILVKDPDCSCYKLSSRIDRIPVLQPLVLLDEEKDIVLRSIDDTDTSLYVPVFAANKEREVHPGACYSFSTNITQSLEKLDSKINHGGFTLFGDHGEIKIMDQLCVAILLHSASVDIG